MGARPVASTIAVAMLLLVSAPPGFADHFEASGWWERASDNNTALCGSGFVRANDDGPKKITGYGTTERVGDDDCGWALSGYQEVKVAAVVQYLGWDLAWHNCHGTVATANGETVTTFVNSQSGGCNWSNVTYRVLTTHGGYTTACCYYDTNHFPLPTGTVVSHTY
jgi:hypothetical protein